MTEMKFIGIPHIERRYSLDNIDLGGTTIDNDTCEKYMVLSILIT